MGARLLSILLLISPLTALAQNPPAGEWSPMAAITRFVQDYENDPAAIAPYAFGLDIDGEQYTVSTQRHDDSIRVRLISGLTEPAAFYFKTDAATLARIDTGAINALTAMGQTRAGDPAPMTLEFADGFTPEDPAAFQKTFLSIAFHFWTRGTPERIPLNADATRIVHGGNAVALYYDPVVHTAWYHVRPGQHINRERRDQINDHPSLFIITQGAGMARLGGKEQSVTKGEAIMIPKGMTHEFWNPGETPFEFVLLMWGFEE